MRLIAGLVLFGWILAAHAGAQKYEPLAASVQAALHEAISDHAAPEPEFPSLEEKINWLTEMSRRLEKRMPDREGRLEFLKTVYYEAKRAGLDPQLVLGLIQVESGFKKYALSPVGARGYMQVMPFWVNLIGQKGSNLFHLRINLRYGCTISKRATCTVRLAVTTVASVRRNIRTWSGQHGNDSGAGHSIAICQVYNAYSCQVRISDIAEESV